MAFPKGIAMYTVPSEVPYNGCKTLPHKSPQRHGISALKLLYSDNLDVNEQIRAEMGWWRWVPSGASKQYGSLSSMGKGHPDQQDIQTQ